MNKARQYYLLALLLALLLHGTVLSFTVGNTYDAYVHMFFGSHYAEGWFETWNYKWYTGFTMTSYPPLVHQIIALLSYIMGLKAAFILWTLVVIGLFIRGIYHFSQIWVSQLVAGYTCLLAVLSSSYIEAVHIFGQLPSITGLALLLNACPELYRWIRFNRWSYFVTGCSIIACLTCAHHVTTIFGMVFFIAPVLGVAVLDIVAEEKGGIDKVRATDFLAKVFRLSPKAILLGVTLIGITICMIFPYWYWSKSDPILQVSIPHGSRANFLEETSLGLVFFIIPWGMMLFFLPGILHKVFHKRNIFLGLSYILLLILGTGGTTPIPILILGENAFNILTLDRFTFWASIIALPFFGYLVHSLVEGGLADFLKAAVSNLFQKTVALTLAILIVITAALVINFGNFKSLQPDAIDVDPIVDFLHRDGHDRWRFMTLGFGDQMAWLSANTKALSVDGNYHSARRLPELTTRAVERIENSKHLGEEGLEALREFISLPEKYNLKYIFSNDKFYEPLLYFYGWTKLRPLENNIDLWERKDVPPLATILPKKDIPLIQKLMWGILPLSSLSFALLLNLGIWFARREDRRALIIKPTDYKTSKKWYALYALWIIGLTTLCAIIGIKAAQAKDYHKDYTELVHAYFHALDFKNFEEAYSFLEESPDLSYEQYCLELSLEDGIMASYAKLDTIEIELIKSPSEKHKKLEVTSHWFTAIQEYKKNEILDLHKSGDDWYIRKKPYTKVTPPDQLINIPDINFHNQGRRKAETNATYREDILDRPDCYINQGHLIKKEGRYHIVGEIQNIDNDPAYVTIVAQLYDKEGTVICTANADEHLIHNLLAKESSPFRIDFDLCHGDEYDQNKVASFAVFARTMVTDEKMYKFNGLRNMSISQSGILEGQYDNYGNKEIAIPQILISSSEDKNIYWVDSKYIDTGIRPQREKDFEYDLTNDTNYFVKQRGTDSNLLVNGSSRSRYRKLLPSRTIKNKTLRYGDTEIQLYTNGLVSF